MFTFIRTRLLIHSYWVHERRCFLDGTRLRGLDGGVLVSSLLDIFGQLFFLGVFHLPGPLY